MRKKDFVSGIVLFCVGAAFFVASVRLPWLDSGYDWHGAPGIMPAILSALLMLTGLRLAFRHNPSDEEDSRVEEEDEYEKTPVVLPVHLNSEPKRALLVVLLCSIYVFGLLGKIPYPLATALFLGTFIFVFRGAGIIKMLLIAGVASTSIWLVFYKIFAVFLP